MTEPVTHQLVEAQRLPQLLQGPAQSDIGFVAVFREAAPFLVGCALPEPLAGCFVRPGSLLTGLRDPEPRARPSELRQPIRVEIRSAPNQQVAVQCAKRGAGEQPGSFIIAGLHHLCGGAEVALVK